MDRNSKKVLNAHLEEEGSGLGVLCTPTASPAQELSLHRMPKILTPSHPISSSPELLGPPTYNIVHTDFPQTSALTWLLRVPTRITLIFGFFSSCKKSPHVTVPLSLVLLNTLSEKQSLSWKKGTSASVLRTFCSPHRQMQRPEGNNSRICCCRTNQGLSLQPILATAGECCTEPGGQRDKDHQRGHREGGAAA